MKIFSLRTLLGVAALYGANRYAKNHGGWRSAAQGVLDKVRQAAEQRQGAMAGGGGSRLDASSDLSPGRASSGGSDLGARGVGANRGYVYGGDDDRGGARS